jgi:single stranded DNA-binding protein
VPHWMAQPRESLAPSGAYFGINLDCYWFVTCIAFCIGYSSDVESNPLSKVEANAKIGNLMSDLNSEFKGNLGDDAKMGVTKDGIVYTRFSVAVTPRKREGEKWVDGETKWVAVTAWRNLAERSAGLKKGQQVAVQGILSLNEYEKDGEKRAGLQVNASEITIALPFVKNGEGASAADSTPVAAAPAAEAPVKEDAGAIF